MYKISSSFIPGIISVVILLLFTSCQYTPAERLVLTSADYEDLPGWEREELRYFMQAWKESCRVNNKPISGYKIAEHQVTHQQVMHICNSISKMPYDAKGSELKHFITSNFAPYKVGSNLGADPLFTGYYLISFHARVKPDGRFKYPIYSLPPDLTTDPYFTRHEIDYENKLSGRNLELLYSDDPVAVFFLHIQGSGIAIMPDGKKVLVGYAGKNNRAYTSIGKYLIEQDVMTKEEVNADTIKSYLHALPAEKRQEVLSINESYVFFSVSDLKPAVGGSGARLTPGRSIAIDPQYYPYGSLIYVVTDLPVTGNHPARKWQRLMIGQDKGGAIKGPLRADLFFGRGQFAEEKAGHLKHRGEMFVLLPR